MFGTNPTIPHVTPQEVEARLGSEPDLLILDVREPHEHAQGHIPGCRLIPLGELAQRLEELPKDREIIVVCRSGGRSAHATQHLLAMGHRAANMAGGMLGWTGPVER